MLKRTLIAVLCFALAAAAQTIKPAVFAFNGDYGPILMPTTATDIPTVNKNGNVSTTATVYVTGIILVEQSGTADTCYVQNRAGTPVGLVGVAGHPMTINASSTYIMTFPNPVSWKALNGLTMACTNGTVSIYLTYQF